MKYKLNESQYKLYKSMLLENQEGDSQKKAKDYLVNKGMDVVDAYNFAHKGIKMIVLPLNHNTKAGKFVFGCTRLIVDEFGIDFNKEDTTFQSFVKKLSKCITAIMSNEELYKKYDKNLNNTKIDTLFKNLNDYLEKDDDDDGQARELNKRYKIVKIHSFQESSEYSDYVSWCITKDVSMYRDYTNNGTCPFFFCLRDDYKNLKEGEHKNEQLLGDYGLSMIAVSIDYEGDLKTCTCRWNHDNGGGDHCMNKKELSDLLGANFKDIFKLDQEDIERANKHNKVYSLYKDFFYNLKNIDEVSGYNYNRFTRKIQEEYGMKLESHQISYELIYNNRILFITSEKFTLAYSVKVKGILEKFFETNAKCWRYIRDNEFCSFYIKNELTNEYSLFKFDGYDVKPIKKFGNHVKGFTNFTMYDQENECYQNLMALQNENGIDVYLCEEDRFIKTDMGKLFKGHIKDDYNLVYGYHVSWSNYIDDSDDMSLRYTKFVFHTNDINKQVIYDNETNKIIVDDADTFDVLDTTNKALYKINEYSYIKDSINDEIIKYKANSNLIEGRFLIIENTEQRKEETGRNFDVYISRRRYEEFNLTDWNIYNYRSCKDINCDMDNCYEGEMIILYESEDLFKFYFFLYDDDRYETSSLLKEIYTQNIDKLYNAYNDYELMYGMFEGKNNPFSTMNLLFEHCIGLYVNTAGDYLLICFRDDAADSIVEINLDDLSGSRKNTNLYLEKIGL